MRIRLLAFLMLLVAHPSLADWVPVFINGYFRGTITLDGYSASVTEPMTSNGVSNGPLSALARPIYALPLSAKSALDEQVFALAASSSSPSISVLSTSISGPIRIALTGLTGVNAGLNQASISGLSYRAILLASGSAYGISFECTVSLAVNDVTTVVTYEPYSGVISADPSLTFVQLNPSSSAYCSNSLDFLPFVGDFINRWAERLITSTAVGQVNDFGASAIRQAIPMGPSFLGIYSAIPPGQYVVSIGGVPFDVGAYLRDNFASLFTGRTLSIVLGPETQVRTLPGTAEPTTYQFVGNAVTVDFSDASTHLVFEVQDVRNFYWRYFCVAGRMICPAIQ